MWELFYKILNFIGDHHADCVTSLSMSETYSSIDATIDGEKYMLTIMKEVKKDDSV